MNSKSGQLSRDKGGWPIAISLVLCALFAAAIILKAKAEFDNQKAVLSRDLARDAQTIAGKLNSNFSTTKNALIAYQGTAISLADAAVNLPNIASIAAFDTNYQPIEMGTARSEDMGPLAAAAQLAGENPWIGALAKSNGSFAPAVALRASDGATVAAILKIPADIADINADINGTSNKALMIANENGAIIYASPKLPIGNAKNLSEAFGTAPSAAAIISTAQTIKLNDSNYITNSAADNNGFLVYVFTPKTAADALWYRSALFYALLFMGPILAFCGIWFMANAQKEQFSRNEAKIRNAEQRLRVAIDGAKSGMWDWDIAADTVFLSKSLALMFGLKEAGQYDTRDVLGKCTKDDQLQLRAALNAAIQNGTMDIILQLMANSVDGQLAQNPPHFEKSTFIQLRGRVLKGNLPNQISVTGIGIDVSEQVKTNAQLQSAQSRLKDTIELIGGPFALWGNNRQLLLWNNEFAEYFELPKGTLKSSALYNDISKLAANAILSRRPVKNNDGTANGAFELELKSGKWLQFIERRASDGGLVSIGIDISAQKDTAEEAKRSETRLRSVVTDLQTSQNAAAELAAQYEVAKNQAEKASKSKDAFLANMSHELRTPLNAINGFSQMMVQQMYGPLGDPHYLDYAKDIWDSGKHLSELINDVLDMAKIEAGKFNIYPAPISLVETIQMATRVVRVKAEEMKVEIEFDLGEVDGMVADARTIKQILINLLSNSIKFSQKNGRILVRCREKDNFVTISVIDNGIGIAEENLPKLGVAFEQVENEHARTRQGTGLGLALVRSFAQMHGGRMELSSQLGVGTKVDIILPKFAVAEQVAA